jgi:hypothetical protein
MKNIPEIYWIKGHNNIPGNERADYNAKLGVEKANQEQLEEINPSLSSYPHYLSNRMYQTFLKKSFIEQWDMDWNNPNFRHEHVFTKYLFPHPTQSINPLLLSLNPQELKLIIRIYTGHTLLNDHLFLVNCCSSPYCNHCLETENEEIIEDIKHFILFCPKYTKHRKKLFEDLGKSDPEYFNNIADRIESDYYLLKTLLTGYPFIYQSIRLQIVKNVIQFIQNTQRRL